MIHEWQYAQLTEKAYPHLMVDVLYMKVRENYRVLSKSCHIAVGISQKGDREVLGLLIQDGESEETWSRFFDDLKERGLHGLDLVISDAHKGLVKAIFRITSIDEARRFKDQVIAEYEG